MKKLFMAIVCLMAMVINVDAQVNMLKIKQVALNKFKSTLIAPSQFVLTDEYGNKISVNNIKVIYEKQVINYDTLYYSDLYEYGTYCRPKSFDSIEVIKKVFQPIYKVLIIGDGRNRMGGYEQIREAVYVDSKYNTYKHSPHKEYIVKSNRVTERLSNTQSESKAFDVVEEMPKFPGGPNAMFEYLDKNLKYPIIAEENGVQGRVIVTFVVECDGSLSDVKVTKSVDPSLDREAQRLVKSMPHWISGKQNGKSVRVKYTVPVTFKLKQLQYNI